MVQIKKGATRVVFIFNRFVIKFPRLCKYRNFLQGLLANEQENYWYNNSPEDIKIKLCPVLFHFPFSFFIIMPTCNLYSELTFEEYTSEFNNIPVEFKKDSFGMYKGKVVAIDYGT